MHYTHSPSLTKHISPRNTCTKQKIPVHTSRPYDNTTITHYHTLLDTSSSPHLDCHFSQFNEIQGLPHLTEAPSAKHAQEDVAIVQAREISVESRSVFTLTPFQFLGEGREGEGDGEGEGR